MFGGDEHPRSKIEYLVNDQPTTRRQWLRSVRRAYAIAAVAIIVVVGTIVVVRSINERCPLSSDQLAALEHEGARTAFRALELSLDRGELDVPSPDEVAYRRVFVADGSMQIRGPGVTLYARERDGVWSVSRVAQWLQMTRIQLRLGSHVQQLGSPPLPSHR